MLDSDRDGPLPRWPWLRGGGWSAGSSARGGTCRDGCSRPCGTTAPGLVLSNVQPASAVPFLAAARRLGAAGRGARGELVPHGRQGRHLAAALRPLPRPVGGDGRTTWRRYHGIGPERVRVTGWPQTDLFDRRRPYGRGTTASCGGFRLDPGLARSCSSRATRPATHRTRGSSSSASSAGGRNRSEARRSSSSSARTRATEQWHGRFAAAAGHEGRRRAGGELYRPA